jgi:serine/threonine protein kinase
MGKVRAATDDAAREGRLDLSEFYSTCDGYLCSGSTGTVRRAWRRSDSSAVALKDVRCPPGEEEVREVTRREYEFMTTLSHPSIVRAFAIHESTANVVVCMEYCDGGSLEGHVKSHGALAPAVATSGARQVLQALDYMHGHRVAHRDVKPANILLNAGATKFKLADFNSAKQIGNHDTLSSIMLTNRGTASYSAPEIHAGHLWNERVDLWSAGLSIYFMRSGRLPFDLEKAGVRNALTRGEAPSMDLSVLGDLMSSLVQQCLEPNPRDRPPAVELLAHTVFRESPAPAFGLTAFTDDLVSACGLVWRLAGADAVGVAKGSDDNVSTHKVFTSPQAEGDQRPLWRRLAERRFARDAIRRSDMPSRRRSVC